MRICRITFESYALEVWCTRLTSQLFTVGSRRSATFEITCLPHNEVTLFVIPLGSQGCAWIFMFCPFSLLTMGDPWEKARWGAHENLQQCGERRMSKIQQVLPLCH